VDVNQKANKVFTETNATAWAFLIDAPKKCCSWTSLLASMKVAIQEKLNEHKILHCSSYDGAFLIKFTIII